MNDPQTAQLSQNDAVLLAEGVTKEYQTSGEKLRVLDGLQLNLRRGEFLAIQGASGVGKSTLLHILGGLDHPSGGSLKFCLAPGHKPVDIARMNGSTLNRFRGKQVGFVFQFHHLLPEFTALENVLLPALIAGVPQEKASERAKNLLGEVGLAERLNHRPTQLSGGEAQRVAIARALINEPLLLLLDEPTGNLDRQRGEQIFDLIGDIHRKRGQTIVVVTHDLEIAARAERRLVLVGGRLLPAG